MTDKEIKFDTIKNQLENIRVNHKMGIIYYVKSGKVERVSTMGDAELSDIYAKIGISENEDKERIFIMEIPEE